MPYTGEELALRAQVETLKLSAYSREEIEAARAAIRSWRIDHPEDATILNFGEILSHASDYVDERERQATALGLTEKERRVRDSLLAQVAGADSAADIQSARNELLNWLTQFPSDAANVAHDLKFLDQDEIMYRLLEDCSTDLEPSYESDTVGSPEPKLSITRQ